MITYFACGAAFVIGILFLTFQLARKAKGDALEREASDDAQIEALCEWRAIQALERDLFAAE